jgi:hypothetical protein
LIPRYTHLVECLIDGCPRTAKCRGYCKNHYIRERNKNRIPKLERPTPLERFARLVKVEPATGCHLWQGAATRPGPDGYGLFKASTKTTRIAHRWLWEQTRGPLPQEMHLDHFVCEVRRCVNLDHVRPTTPRENVLRSPSPAGDNLAKTHCKEGHPFDTENTYTTPDGKRQCRTCKRAAHLRRRSYLSSKRST